MTKTMRTAIVALLLVLAAAAPGVAQQPAQAASTYAPPKTAWGDPDLQGIWPGTAMVGVPFERPAQFGTRLFLTDAEFSQRQKDADKLSAVYDYINWMYAGPLGALIMRQGRSEGDCRGITGDHGQGTKGH